MIIKGEQNGDPTRTGFAVGKANLPPKREVCTRGANDNKRRANLLDSHCHLYNSQYDTDREEVISDIFASGIEKVICVGADIESSKSARDLAESHDSIYYTIGVHPDDCDSYDENVIENMIRESSNKLVAIGEIGLDYFHNKDNKSKQIEVFISQINLAIKYKLPIVIHCREAYGDTLDILKRFAPLAVPIVFHCYSGSLEYSRELLRLGIKMSFTGNVTFKNAKNIQEVASNLPLDSFFFETDSPYMSPVPHRGERNTPKYVWDVARFVADLRGISADELIKITDENAKHFFKF